MSAFCREPLITPGHSHRKLAVLTLCAFPPTGPRSYLCHLLLSSLCPSYIDSCPSTYCSQLFPLPVIFSSLCSLYDQLHFWDFPQNPRSQLLIFLINYLSSQPSPTDSIEALFLCSLYPFTVSIAYVPMHLWCASHWKIGPRAVFGREGP